MAGGDSAAEIAKVLLAEGVDLPALGLAWARATPTVVLVPAFGLRALPQGARLVFALALAASVYPACAPLAVVANAPWPLLVVGEVVRGLPIALASAVPLWAATMSGGLVDNLRGGAGDGIQLAVLDGRTTPLGSLFGLLAGCIFLGIGGPARVARALIAPAVSSAFLPSLIETLTSGIGVSVALGAPLVAAAVVLEVASTLVARAANPSQVGSVLAPAKNLAIVALVGLLLERLATVLAGWIASGQSGMR